MDKIDAIYARQSVDKADSISIESQIDFCKYETRGNPYLVFADKGYSGKNTDRPQFQKMLQEIRLGKISRVICYKLDRCSRSILDFATLIQEFEKNRVEFISCTEKFDTSTPIGRAMLNICIVFAQLERETIQQRVYDAYHNRNIKGFYMGGRVPFGYRLVPFWIDGKKTACYEAEPKEIEIVNLVFHTYANPKTSLGDVARYLSSTGIAVGWSRAKISRILSNPIYVMADKDIYNYFFKTGVKIYNQSCDFIGENGCYLYHKDKETKELILAPHKGIVKSELWLRCIQKLKEYPHRNTSNKIKNTFLAGKMKCLSCGYALTISITKRKNAEYRYIMCSMSNKSKEHCTGIHGIKAAVIENIVFLELEKKVSKLGYDLTAWDLFSVYDKLAIVDLLIDKILISETNMRIYWKI